MHEQLNTREQSLPVIIEAIELGEGRLMVGARSADEGERVLCAEAVTASSVSGVRFSTLEGLTVRYGLHHVSAYPFGRLTVDSGYSAKSPYYEPCFLAVTRV